MKHMLSFLIALAVLLAATPSFAGAMADKFNGGVKSITHSPMQVVDNIRVESEAAKILPIGVVGGFLKGAFYMVKDIVTGTFDVVTSPLELRK